MCVSNTILAVGVLVVKEGGFGGFWRLARSFDKDVRVQVFYSAVSYVGAMVSTNYALTHVTYPTQVLVKSVKMVPVIVGGFVFFGKRYPWYDYVAVLVVTSSLAMFNLARVSAAHSAGHQTTLGIVFLLVSLACDALTGPRQDRMLALHPEITSIQLMFLTNGFAVMNAGAALVVFEGVEPFLFCFRNLLVTKYILAFCVCASMGQLFIFGCLTNFGSLYLTLVTTTRKFFTVLLSVVLFGHSINKVQWMCVVSIFATLMCQGVCSKMAKARRKQQKVIAEDGDKGSKIA
uniref:Sugar phosphate transporter domain-containing protein n=2 Tax=Lankesteria abbotti TaxID=340204 RepID=A0A7S2QQL5_9APIC|mmetsp:Transcript_1363/g.1570  ORF Transcript_1363/g.1570 Transcript_1363/m.1570 type:complete len:290 (+) Transcript_1363:160-1029(+)